MNEAVVVNDSVRLVLYIAMGIFPVWQDFFTRSTDYSFRGLAMPIIASLTAAVTIALAKTKSKSDVPQPAQPVIPTPPQPPNPLPPQPNPAP